MKHDFYLDEYGKVDVFRISFGDYHDGPECRRCNDAFCAWCEPDRLDEECPSGQLEFDLIY